MALDPDLFSATPNASRLQREQARELAKLMSMSAQGRQPWKVQQSQEPSASELPEAAAELNLMGSARIPPPPGTQVAANELRLPASGPPSGGPGARIGSAVKPQFAYGLEAGQMPKSVDLRDFAALIRTGMPLETAAQVMAAMKPDYQTDPITGRQYAVLPNGQAIPIGQGIPTTTKTKIGDMELTQGWERTQSGARPKFFLPGDDGEGGPGAGPPSSDSKINKGGPQFPKGGGINALTQWGVDNEAYKKGRVAAGEEEGKARIGLWKDVIDAGKQSAAVRQDLATMRNAYANAPEGGPLNPALDTMRRTITQLFPDSAISDATASTQIIDKTNFGMATKLVRAITARPTQMEVVLGMRNLPGMSMSNKAAGHMIDLLDQVEIQRQELYQVASRLRGEDINRWPEIEEQYYKSHPLVSPIDGKVLQGTGAFWRQLEESGEMRPKGAAPSGAPPNPLAPRSTPPIQRHGPVQ